MRPLSPDQFRVAVTGGRKYSDRLTAYRWLESMLARAKSEGRFFILLHGRGDGLDQISEDWKQLRGVERWDYPARWLDITHRDAVIRATPDGRKYDAAEGPRRSRRMIDEGQPHILGAFPGGPGTAACVYHACVNGVDIVKVTPELVRPHITKRTLLAALDNRMDVPAIIASLDPALSEADQAAYIDATRTIREVLMQMEASGLVESATVGRGVPSWRRTEAGERVLRKEDQ